MTRQLFHVKMSKNYIFKNGQTDFFQNYRAENLLIYLAHYDKQIGNYFILKMIEIDKIREPKIVLFEMDILTFWY